LFANRPINWSKLTCKRSHNARSRVSTFGLKENEVIMNRSISADDVERISRNDAREYVLGAIRTFSFLIGEHFRILLNG